MARVKGKAFVLARYPDAGAERHRTNGHETYWLIRRRGQFMYLTSGKTESEAWRKAAEQICAVPPAELRALLAKADWSDPTHPATERLTDALPALLDVVNIVPDLLEIMEMEGVGDGDTATRMRAALAKLETS